jgi:signal transduction histidine kinase
MKNRAEQIGGRLIIKSRKGEGTTLEFRGKIN